MKEYLRYSLCFLFLTFTGGLGHAEETDTLTEETVVAEIVQDKTLKDYLVELTEAGFREKEDLVLKIVETDEEQTLPVMQALLEGDLYYVKDDNTPVYKTDADPVTVFGGETLSGLGSRDIKKISVNNSLRILLRTEISRLELFSKDVSVRKTAAENLLKSADDLNPELLAEALTTETNSDVKDVLLLVEGIAQLSSDDSETRFQGVDALAGSLYPEVRGAQHHHAVDFFQRLFSSFDLITVASLLRALDKIHQRTAQT